MPVRWENMDNESQFFYQSDFLCGAYGMGDNNDENVGGEDSDMQTQPSYLDFSSYFMTDKVYFIRLLFVCVLCFVTK